MSHNNDVPLDIAEALEAQLERERASLKDGIIKQNNDLQKDKQRGYFSHTRYGKEYRERVFPRLRRYIAKAIDNLTDEGVGHLRAEKDLMIQSFLTACKHLKENNTVHVFDKEESLGELYDLLTHVTLTAMLDNAATTYNGAKNKGGTLRKPAARNKNTLDELEVELGEELNFQIRLYLLSLVIKRWVDGVSKHASHKGLANLHYHHYNVNRLIKTLVAEIKIQAEAVRTDRENATNEFSSEERARILKAEKGVQALLIFDDTWSSAKAGSNHKSTYKLNKFMGQWMISIALHDAKLDAFMVAKDFITSYKRTSGGKIRKKSNKPVIEARFAEFLSVTPDKKAEWKHIATDDDEAIESLSERDRSKLMLRRPMLIPPMPLSNQEQGGWLGDNSPLLESFKGGTDLSQTHIDFFNNQMRTAFKINPFILRLLEILDKGESGERTEVIKLGSFKPHTIVKPRKTSSRLSFQTCDGWSDLTSDEQKDWIIHQVGQEAWNKAKAEVNKEWETQYDLKRKGSASRQGLSMAQELVKHDRFYFPIRPDFRNRVVVRTPHVHYQGTDHGKALIKFADAVPKDDFTEKWLLINMANHYGGKLDKASFHERVAVMQSKIAEITAVARMTEEEYSWEAGFEVLKHVDSIGGKCFQFAASAREYFQLFIAETKTTTDLIVTVDCSTSGQQIASVWMKSTELAAQTNVKNNDTGRPADLYGAVFTKMLSMMRKDGRGFHKATEERLVDLGFGRAICKASIQGAQYGSGKDTQIKAINEKIEELESKGQLYMLRRDEDTVIDIEDEPKLFVEYFPDALEAVCHLSILNTFFKDLAEEVHKAGGTEIKIPTPIGSTVNIVYQPLLKRRIRTYNYGQTKVGRKTQILEPNEAPTEADRKEQLAAWKSGCCPNATHAYDATLIALALHDFEHPFTSCHDSLGTHASHQMEILRMRLKQALVKISEYNVFDELLKVNKVKVKKPPVHEWVDMKSDILKAEYFTG